MRRSFLKASILSNVEWYSEDVGPKTGLRSTIYKFIYIIPFAMPL